MRKLENVKMGPELTNENLRFGLNQKQLQLITETIVSFPEIEKVFIFGSRAIDTNRPCSDIDLALSGQQLTRTICNRFSSALDDLTLPFLFDVVDYNQIENDNLKTSIDTEGKVFFERKLNCA